MFLFSLLAVTANAQIESFITDVRKTNIHNFNGYCVKNIQEYEVRFGEAVPVGEMKTEVTGVWYDSHGFRVKELSNDGHFYEIENSYDNNGKIKTQDIYLNKKLYEKKTFSYGKGTISIITYDANGKQANIEVWSNASHTIQKGTMSAAGGSVTKTIEGLNAKGYPISITFASNTNVLGHQVEKSGAKTSITYNEHNDRITQTLSINGSASKQMGMIGILTGKTMPTNIEYKGYEYDTNGNWISRYAYHDGVCAQKEERRFMTEQEFLSYERTAIAKEGKIKEETYGHMNLKIDKPNLAAEFNKLSLLNFKQKDIDIKSKVWVMEDGSLKIDEKDIQNLAAMDKTLLEDIVEAIRKSTKPIPAYKLSKNSIDKITIPESFNLNITGNIFGEKAPTGSIMKLAKNANNIWEIENKTDLKNKGYSESLLEKLISTYQLSDNKKGKLKLSIDRTPIELRIEITPNSYYSDREGSDASFNDLRISSYTLSKSNGLSNILGTVAGALDALSK